MAIYQNWCMLDGDGDLVDNKFDCYVRAIKRFDILNKQVLTVLLCLCFANLIQAATSTENGAHYAVKASLKALIASGDASAFRDDPLGALYFYRVAYVNAHDKNDILFQRIALFKLAKMQLWLGLYKDASNSYKLLLVLKLEPLEYELALAGLIKSLNYYH